MKHSFKWLKNIVLTSLLVVSSASMAVNVDQKQIDEAVQKEIQRLIKIGGLDEAIQNGISEFLVRREREAANNKQAAETAQAKKMRPIDPKRDHIEGNPDALVSVVEYSDFECPFCKRHHETMKKLIENNNGKVNWVYRHFPLDFHNPGAESQSEAAECAAKLGGNDIFWTYAHTIYERTNSNGNGFPIAKLVPLAKELGLDEAKFKTCLESGEMKQRVQEDLDNGKAAGVRGTPGGIMVNNKTGHVIASPGALPIQQLQARVDRLLKAKPGDK